MVSISFQALIGVPDYSQRFKCPYCPDATFGNSSNFKRHLNLHSGLRPYKCPHCQYAATRKEHLCYHLARKHPIALNSQSN